MKYPYLVIKVCLVVSLVQNGISFFLRNQRNQQLSIDSPSKLEGWVYFNHYATGDCTGAIQMQFGVRLGFCTSMEFYDFTDVVDQRAMSVFFIFDHGHVKGKYFSDMSCNSEGTTFLVPIKTVNSCKLGSKLSVGTYYSPEASYPFEFIEAVAIQRHAVRIGTAKINSDNYPVISSYQAVPINQCLNIVAKQTSMKITQKMLTLTTYVDGDCHKPGKVQSLNYTKQKTFNETTIQRDKELPRHHIAGEATLSDDDSVALGNIRGPREHHERNSKHKYNPDDDSMMMNNDDQQLHFSKLSTVFKFSASWDVYQP